MSLGKKVIRYLTQRDQENLLKKLNSTSLTLKLFKNGHLYLSNSNLMLSYPQLYSGNTIKELSEIFKDIIYQEYQVKEERWYLREEIWFLLQTNRV